MKYNLLLALAAPLTTYTMDTATLAQQVLVNPEATLYQMPMELQERAAHSLLQYHPVVDYIKRTAELCIATIEGHTSDVNSASYSSDGTRVVTASDDGTAKIWNALTGQCLHTLQGHTSDVISASYSPDGTTIVTASFDNTAKIWDAQTGQCLHTLQGHTNYVESARYSPDGTRVVTASGNRTAKIWNALTGQCLHTLEGHTNIVNSASYSLDGTKVVTASDDDTAKIWDAQTGQCLHTLEGHTNIVWSARYSPDGTTIVTASDDGTAKIWNAQNGQCLHTLQGHNNDHIVWSASYSPDGTQVVTASDDETAKIWDVATTLERFFARDVTLPQAVLLNALYEIVVARALVKRHGQKAFIQDTFLDNQNTSSLSENVSSSSTQEVITHEDILFDFNQYPHLREHYHNLPAMIQKCIEPFIIDIRK